MSPREACIRSMPATEVDQLIADDLSYPAAEENPPAIAQAELVGEPFTRQAAPGKILQGQEVARFTTERMVRIVVAYNTATGELEARPLEDTNINGRDLPHIPLARAATVFALEDMGSPSISTARKQKSSKPFVDTEAAIRARGGDPTYRCKKPRGSFLLRNTYDQLYTEDTPPAPLTPEPEEDSLAGIEF